MTTAATSLLGLALPVTGELSGTWGTTVNDSITSLLDTAVAGTTTLSTDGDVTLSTTTLAANQARQAILLCSGARTAIRTITAPAQSKIYTIINATTGGYAVKLVGVGPTTGLTIPNGASAVVAWNGSDFIEIGSSTIGNLTVNGNLTVTGTTTLSGGTANGVAYLNGSKVVTTGSALTFDGTGKLGVGTTTPLSGVSAGFEAVGEIWATTASSNSNQIRLSPSTSGANIIYSTYSGSGSYLPLAFNVSGSEGMRLTSTGLGIGTSSPAYKLDVAGAVMRLINSGANADLFLTDSGTTNGNVRLRGVSNALQLITGGGVSATLDSSGNLGLGVTPSSWGSGYAAFQLPNGGAFWAQKTSAPTVVTSANAVFTGSAYNYIGSYAATLAIQSGGQHQWYNAASGTAGNAITFTQAMTLDSSGNLLVGKTSVGASNVGFQLNNVGEITVSNTATTNAGATQLNVYSTGASAYRFYVGMGGTIYATSTTITAISDQRLKENIQDIDVGLNAIMALKPRKFDWKAGKGKDIKGDRGWIAQEFEQVFPDLIDEWKDPAPEGEEPYKAVRADLIPVLVKALQEMKAIIDEQADRIAALEAK